MSRDRYKIYCSYPNFTLLIELESKYLRQHTPCKGFSDNELAEAIGIVHVELIIIAAIHEGFGGNYNRIKSIFLQF